MEKDFVRRLPGSPDDFQEIETTSRKSRRLPEDIQEVQRLLGSPGDLNGSRLEGFLEVI
ncbi:hypothetical protein F2Q70_00021648 [Brassica cretica]|uniref:Uncharacterized protein n=1 Tax=Brassica cretica TaxID=69181 RepID=A0A8S9GLS8_BRACR|nr:hypothetical protein F2Q70_00021648 [Brassica cretica]